MTGRGWVTVILTALAGPMGSAVLAVGLARWTEVTTGGMAVLGALVVGIWLGGPPLAILVFAICLLTLLRDAPIRRWLAILLMLAAVLVEAIVVLIGLRLVGGGTSPEVGLVVVGILALAVLGSGAFIAMAISRRRISAEAAD